MIFLLLVVVNSFIFAQQNEKEGYERFDNHIFTKRSEVRKRFEILTK